MCAHIYRTQVTGRACAGRIVPETALKEAV